MESSYCSLNVPELQTENLYIGSAVSGPTADLGADVPNQRSFQRKAYCFE